MVKIPELKKKISSFLTKEDGKISKEALIKTGILLGFATIASLKADAACPPDTLQHSEHCNELALNAQGTTAAGTHHHGHGSHAAHGSHGSHSSNGHPW